MQRHGHQQIRLAQQRSARARHVRRQHRGELGAVGVLERQDQPSPLCVVAQRGAGALEHRRCAAAAGTEVLDAAQGRICERNAAACAERLGDEAGLPEALGTQQARRIDRRTAGGAVRRQQQVEQRTAGPPRRGQ